MGVLWLPPTGSPRDAIGWHSGTVSPAAGADRRCGWLVYFPKGSTYLVFTGTASLLCWQCLRGECPTGILLDRLEECPEEGGGPKSLVLVVVQYFRQKVRL